MLSKVIDKYRDVFKSNFRMNYNTLKRDKNVASAVITAFIPLLSVIVIINYFLFDLITTSIIFVSWLGSIIIYIANKKYDFKYSFAALCIIFSLDLHALIILNEGIRDIVFYTYPVILLVSGFTLNKKFFLILTSVNYLILLTVGILQYSGILVKELDPNITLIFLLNFAIVVLALNILGYLMIVISQKREDSLKESNAVKDRFFKILAHDLRNPFQVLIGISKMLEEDYDSFNDEERRNLISKVVNTVDEQYNLLEKLLYYGKLQTGVYVTSFTDVNISQLLLDSMQTVSALSHDKHIKQTLKIPDAVTISGDEFLLHTAVRNLISNAFKYTASGGEIAVTLTEKDKFAEIAVQDNGIGMAHERIKELLESNSVDSVAGLKGELGTGLGIVLIKEIVTLHKGSIRIDSKPGYGSTFVIRFPKNLFS